VSKPHYFGFFIFCFLFLIAPLPRLRNPQVQKKPPDFTWIKSDLGVSLFKRERINGIVDFVLLVSLSQSASIKFNHGGIVNPGKGDGVYGGDNPEFSRETLIEIWDSFARSDMNAFCITNGEFFSPNLNPTVLAFPLKKDGIIVSDGYGINEYKNEKLMLEVWINRADISLLTGEKLYSSSADNLIVGLSEHATKKPNDPIARTFVGVADFNFDGLNETVLLFNSTNSTQSEAAITLRKFGADKVMMLDGGSSTQLICDGQSYIKSSSTIPQTIAISSGKKYSLPALEIGKREWFLGIIEEIHEKLQNEISDKVDEQLDNIKNAYTEWLERQVDKRVNKLCNPMAGMIPLVIILVLLLIGRRLP